MSTAERSRAEGRVQAQAERLLRLPTLTFGAPSDASRRRVDEADGDRPREWTDRILTAEAIDDVLRP